MIFYCAIKFGGEKKKTQNSLMDLSGYKMQMLILMMKELSHWCYLMTSFPYHSAWCWALYFCCLLSCVGRHRWASIGKEERGTSSPFFPSGSQPASCKSPTTCHSVTHCPFLESPCLYCALSLRCGTLKTVVENR